MESISDAAVNLHEAVSTMMFSGGCAAPFASVDHDRAARRHCWLPWAVEDSFQTLSQQNTGQRNRKADAWHGNVTYA